MNFITDNDRKLESLSITFEDRLCEAIQSGSDLDPLMQEAKQIFESGYFTKKEYETLTDIDLYKEIYL